MRSVAIVGGLAACYSPAPPLGAPCAMDRSCPAPLACNATTLTCEPVGFTPPDADIDAPDGDTTCWSRWRDGSVRLSEAVPLVQMAPMRTQHDPSLSGDELTLYFVREDSTSDLWRATRSTRADEFADPVRLSLSSTTSDYRLTASGASDEVIFGSARSGGVGGVDFWSAVPAGDDFGPPTQMGLAAVNSVLSEYDPELTANGLGLFFGGDSAEGLAIFASRRSAIDGAFTGPVRVDVRTNLADSFTSDPTLSPDETVLAYSRDTAAEPRRIYYAVGGPAGYDERGVVPGLEDLSAVDPELTSDGCQLYFATGGNIVVATVVD